MTECYSCGVEFKVVFEDEDASVEYCPSCGCPMDQEELDFE